MNKTPEEILTLKFEGFQTQIPVPLHAIQRAFIIAAMEEYASQEVVEKDKIIKKIKSDLDYYQKIIHLFEQTISEKEEKIKELEAVIKGDVTIQEFIKKRMDSMTDIDPEINKVLQTHLWYLL